MRAGPTLGVAARLFLRAPRPLLRAIAGPPRRSDLGEELDLGTQVMLAMMERLGMPTTDQLDVTEARAEFEADMAMIAPHPLTVGRMEGRFVATDTGPIPLRVYWPRKRRSGLPMLVYYHGGGFVTGSLDTHDSVCGRFCLGADCIVVSVDYRLAPEHIFPAAVEDAERALAWTFEHAAELGGDAERVAVGGDSAGGNLSAVVSRRARDSGGRRPCFQLLVYPATDLTCAMPSHRSLGQGYFLTNETIDWYLSRYAPDPATHRHPDASPLFANDLSGLPPALMVTTGFDPLRDEGARYFERLREAGVHAERQHEAGLVHGFLNMAPMVGAASAAFDRIVGTTRRALHADP